MFSQTLQDRDFISYFVTSLSENQPSINKIITRTKTKTQHGQVIFSLQLWMLEFVVHSPRSIQERGKLFEETKPLSGILVSDIMPTTKRNSRQLQIASNYSKTKGTELTESEIFLSMETLPKDTTGQWAEFFHQSNCF